MPPRTCLVPSPVVLLLGLLLPAPAAAQDVARVSVEQENFRKAPGGTKLATLMRGAEFSVLERQQEWLRVRLGGWIWAPSVESAARGGYDLVVSKNGGENIRATPNGRIVARALEGMLLDRMDRQGRWLRVRRDAWVWGESVTVSGGEGSGGGATSDEASPTAIETERRVVGGSSTDLRRSPEGDTAAVLRPGADLRVLAREGEWARVRVDGWVRSGSLVSPDSAGVMEDLTFQDLRQNPEEYRGRRVRWTVQFVSLRRAEAIRTDFYEGEPFMLARPPGSSEKFVYLAVPPELLSRVREFEPLQEIQVLARVRTGRSSLMGVPILDLLALY